MTELSRAWRIWKKGFGLKVASEMAYKLSFFLLVTSIIIKDMIGPLMTFIIYDVSKGIPGWSMMEFILFQGIVIFVFGIWHAFIGGISWGTSELVEEGELESALVKPFNVLAYIAALYIDFHGLAEVLVGAGLMLWAMIALNLFSWTLIPFILLIALALLFILSIAIIIAALSLIFVNVSALNNMIGALMMVAAYPITIYSQGVRFILTFIIPAAIASYWPAAILLGKESASNLITGIIPIFVFFAFSLWLWNYAMKRYQSAGG